MQFFDPNDSTGSAQSHFINRLRRTGVVPGPATGRPGSPGGGGGAGMGWQGSNLWDRNPGGGQYSDPRGRSRPIIPQPQNQPKPTDIIPPGPPNSYGPVETGGPNFTRGPVPFNRQNDYIMPGPPNSYGPVDFVPREPVPFRGDSFENRPQGDEEGGGGLDLSPFLRRRLFRQEF